MKIPFNSCLASLYYIIADFYADYMEPLFAEILAGTLDEGGARFFTVGIDPQVGANYCDATAEQVEMLDAFNKRIGAGDFGEKIFEILSEAYGF